MASSAGKKSKGGGLASSTQKLDAICIIEHDVNKDTMCVWSYPAVDAELERVLIARSQLDNDAEDGSYFSRYKDNWHYAMSVSQDLPNEALPKVTKFSINIVAKDFNPEKYDALANLLAEQYWDGGHPTTLLGTFLQVFTNDKVSAAQGSWSAAAHDGRKALVSGSALKEVIDTFGAQSVLLWNAMLLKKRVIVRADSKDELLPAMRALPQLVWHRQDWTLLRPFITDSAQELADLEAAGVYCAGVTSDGFHSKTNLYDVYVDVSAGAIEVADHAKPSFQLGKFHRDVAALLTKTAAAASDAQPIIKAVAMKNKELTSTIKTLGTGGQVSLADIQAKRMTPAMESFLYAVAVADGFSKAA